MRSNNLLLLAVLLFTDLAPALPLDHESRALLSYSDSTLFSKRDPIPPLDSEDAERMYVSYLLNSFNSLLHLVIVVNFSALSQL